MLLFVISWKFKFKLQDTTGTILDLFIYFCVDCKYGSGNWKFVSKSWRNSNLSTALETRMEEVNCNCWILHLVSKWLTPTVFNLTWKAAPWKAVSDADVVSTCTGSLNFALFFLPIYRLKFLDGYFHSQMNKISDKFSLFLISIFQMMAASVIMTLMNWRCWIRTQLGKYMYKEVRSSESILLHPHS